MSAVMNRDDWKAFERWLPPEVGESAAPEPAPVETVQQPTVRDLEALEEQAREEGYAAGHAQGMAEARDVLQERMQRLDALLESAARPLRSMDELVELELARLAMTVARQVLAHELRTAPDLVVEAVRQAALALPSATGNLRVRLHPDDLALLRSLDMVESHWQLLPDNSLQRGDCLLESERSRLDARVETRLAAVVDAVLGAEAEETDEDADEVRG
ncbi:MULTISPECIES: flagellar assembly protein FliH [unclassified Dyella]|uniref:flagellar assembly protein FliH n=1 Tax=unclassified Dyella TaxID=2634549 RepID=UPI000C860093|nr:MULTISPECIES: flagellar assembly protein FliH [unclassified Dyella]MDR3445579.1 flagellar assembly protein FliH [Dyella sp.]PMQ06979.1 Flagellar assembly protein FliH [Dyella sp. AD56]